MRLKVGYFALATLLPMTMFCFYSLYDLYMIKSAFILIYILITLILIWFSLVVIHYEFRPIPIYKLKKYKIIEEETESVFGGYYEIYVIYEKYFLFYIKSNNTHYGSLDAAKNAIDELKEKDKKRYETALRVLNYHKDVYKE